MVNSGQEIISYRLSQPWLVYEPIWKFDSKKKELDNLLSHLKDIIEKVSCGKLGSFMINIIAIFIIRFRNTKVCVQNISFSF